MENLNICMLQLDLAWEDAAANRQQIEEMLVGEVGKHDLIILPEMFTTGFSMSPAGLAEPMNGDTAQWMQVLAGKTGAVVMGSLIISEGEQFYNRMLVVSSNGIAMTYDKRHLFRMAGETEVYTQGKQLQVFSLKGWRVCPQICYDLRFPVWSRNSHKEGEDRLWYDLLVYSANWPAARVSHWNTLLQARAIENQSYVAGVNRCGQDDNGIAYSGDSALIGFKGERLLHAADKPQLLTQSLDWEALKVYRTKFPAWQDGDQYEMFA